MKLSEEQIALIKSCSTADELVAKAAAEGMTLSLEDAQDCIDAFPMVELDEKELNSVAGGCSVDSNDDWSCSMGMHA